jgi:hypothetical protein
VGSTQTATKPRPPAPRPASSVPTAASYSPHPSERNSTPRARLCPSLSTSTHQPTNRLLCSDHSNFEESTEVIKPLTEEEKKAKLAELRERLAAKRAAQASQDLAETKKNEAIRRKKTQETEQLKEELRRREQLKEVEKRKREQREDALAKERVRQKIREQQEAKRLQAEAEKAAREGKPAPTAAQPGPATPAAAPTPPKVSASHSESRLQLRLPQGQPLVKTFPAETTLFEVAGAVENERGMCLCSNRWER